MRSQEFIRQTMEVRYTTVSRAEDVLDAVRAHADMVRPEGDTTVTEKL
jgi:hypothetical protein